MLAGRSGHQVYIDTPDAPLIGYQPPLDGQTFHEALSQVGSQLIDVATVAIGCPLLPADIRLRVWRRQCGHRHQSRANLLGRLLSHWSGALRKWPLQSAWEANDWPVGPLAAATLVAAEAFKIAGRALLPHSSNAGHFPSSYLLRASRRRGRRIYTQDRTASGDFDVISAGAVSNAFLFAIMRIPDVSGTCRTFDEDKSEGGNRNRNMLLLPRHLGNPKVHVFEHFGNGIEVKGLPRHFVEADLPTLAPRVVVGVDDIPTRWLLAGARVNWMGVGATTHFAAMASVHYPYAACAACLHPRDEVIEGPTPTVAFVSFMSGLMVAGDFLRDLGAAEVKLASHYRYVVPLRMDGEWADNVRPDRILSRGLPGVQNSRLDLR